MGLLLGRAPSIEIHSGVDMPGCGEQVEPPITVAIEKSSAPSEERNRDLALSGVIGDIREAASAIVAVEGVIVVREICDKEVEQTIVVIVADCEAHGRLGKAGGV